MTLRMGKDTLIFSAMSFKDGGNLRTLPLSVCVVAFISDNTYSSISQVSTCYVLGYYNDNFISSESNSGSVRSF